MIEETREAELVWNSDLDRKLQMLFDELLDFRDQFSYFQGEMLKDKTEKEIKELEYQLDCKKELVGKIENNHSRSYEERYRKQDEFRGVRY